MYCARFRRRAPKLVDKAHLAAADDNEIANVVLAVRQDQLVVFLSVLVVSDELLEGGWGSCGNHIPRPSMMMR